MTIVSSPRDLVRRWYGQIKQQPEPVANKLVTLAAHTVVADRARSEFGQVEFASLSSVIDLVLHSEVDATGNVTGLSLRGYRASYDCDTNRILVGGANNFVVAKDCTRRPFKGGRNWIIDPEYDRALLMAALEMESEREAVTKKKDLMQFPWIAEVYMSFLAADAPKYEESVALRQLAWDLLQPYEPALRALSTPSGYEGEVKTIVHDSEYGRRIVEIIGKNGNSDLCFEAPGWAKCCVQRGQIVRGDEEIIIAVIPRQYTDPILDCGHDELADDSNWTALESVIGEPDTNLLLHLVWDSVVSPWGKTGMITMPHYLVSKENQTNITGVWRDLRHSLGRECHHYKDPKKVIRSGPLEGKIRVWDMGNTAGSDVLRFPILGGEVDLYSLPFGDASPIAGKIEPVIVEEVIAEAMAA